MWFKKDTFCFYSNLQYAQITLKMEEMCLYLLPLWQKWNLTPVHFSFKPLLHFHIPAKTYRIHVLHLLKVKIYTQHKKCTVAQRLCKPYVFRLFKPIILHSSGDCTSSFFFLKDPFGAKFTVLDNSTKPHWKFSSDITLYMVWPMESRHLPISTRCYCLNWSKYEPDHQNIDCNIHFASWDVIRLSVA